MPRRPLAAAGHDRLVVDDPAELETVRRVLDPVDPLGKRRRPGTRPMPRSTTHAGDNLASRLCCPDCPCVGFTLANVGETADAVTATFTHAGNVAMLPYHVGPPAERVPIPDHGPPAETMLVTTPD